MTRLTGKILVVDDDPAICVVVSEALKRQGHIIRTAGSIAERHEALASFMPDVLITDVILPDGDGLDDVGGILASEPDLKVIILSAQNTLNTAVRATETGASLASRARARSWSPRRFTVWALAGTSHLWQSTWRPFRVN